MRTDHRRPGHMSGRPPAFCRPAGGTGTPRAAVVRGRPPGRCPPPLAADAGAWPAWCGTNAHDVGMPPWPVRPLRLSGIRSHTALAARPPLRVLHDRSPPGVQTGSWPTAADRRVATNPAPPASCSLPRLPRTGPSTRQPPAPAGVSACPTRPPKRSQAPCTPSCGSRRRRRPRQQDVPGPLGPYRQPEFLRYGRRPPHRPQAACHGPGHLPGAVRSLRWELVRPGQAPRCRPADRTRRPPRQRPVPQRCGSRP
ncbi:hypothetical protein SAMN05216532_0189 [Streptomyces sp. 2231.1]|nr:hypothetical protein SAMN05216532_0189 [Streptomyces sp. 2231.1]